MNSPNQMNGMKIQTDYIIKSQTKRVSQCKNIDKKQGQKKNQMQSQILEQKIKHLQIQIRQYQIEKQFFLMQLGQKQQYTKQLTKRTVFLQEKQQQIKKGHSLFSELIQNKQFTHAQLKFLKLCLEKSKKDKMAFQLIKEQKEKQAARFFENTEKIKLLLLKHTENMDLNYMNKVNQEEKNQSTLMIQCQNQLENKYESQKKEKKTPSKLNENHIESQKFQINNSNLNKNSPTSASNSNLSKPINKNKPPILFDNELSFYKKQNMKYREQIKELQQELIRKNIILQEKQSLQRQEQQQQAIDSVDIVRLSIQKARIREYQNNQLNFINFYSQPYPAFFSILEQKYMNLLKIIIPHGIYDSYIGYKFYALKENKETINPRTFKKYLKKLQEKRESFINSLK